MNNIKEINKDCSFYCEKCNYRTSNSYTYEEHLRTIAHRICKGNHRNEIKIYKCDQCTFQGYNRNRYMNHILNTHNTLEERREKSPYFCNECGVGVVVDSLMERHLKSKKHLLKIYQLNPETSGLNLCEILNMKDDDDDEYELDIVNKYMYEINTGLDHYQR